MYKNFCLVFLKRIAFSAGLLVLFLLSGCQGANQPAPSEGLKVLVVESFLADITRNVAGDRTSVDSLIPVGMDPHAYEPTPKDVARISESQVLVVNGGGLEAWLQPVLDSLGGQRRTVVASAGLQSRLPRASEEGSLLPARQAQMVDPHFWLDPLDVVQYVQQIRDGLILADPAGAEAYRANVDAYITKLHDLDAWIRQQVSSIPPEQRLLVTNHEEFGYFADRYGFTITGAIIPSFTTGSSPSAQELARLIEQIRKTKARAIFLELGSNPQLAEQIASETSVKVVTGLFTHSITPAGGAAPTYLDMMRANVTVMVAALK